VTTIFLDKTITGLAALSIATFLLFLSWWIQKKEYIRKKLPVRVEEWEKVEDEACRFLESFEREVEVKERPFYGAIMFMLAVGFTFIVFPETAAVVAVLVLSVSDSASTLVGVHLGNTSIPYSKKKSLEGFSAFFTTAFIISLVFVSPVQALLVSLVGAFVESLPRLDDNFSVPLAVALLLMVL